MPKNTRDEEIRRIVRSISVGNVVLVLCRSPKETLNDFKEFNEVEIRYSDTARVRVRASNGLAVLTNRTNRESHMGCQYSEIYDLDGTNIPFKEAAYIFSRRRVIPKEYMK